MSLWRKVADKATHCYSAPHHFYGYKYALPAIFLKAGMQMEQGPPAEKNWQTAGVHHQSFS
jgi:hypothetical protein